MKTLVQRQEECLSRMHEARTSERRAAKNRSAAIASLRKQCSAIGYSRDEINQIVADVRDMYELQKNADE